MLNKKRSGLTITRTASTLAVMIALGSSQAFAQDEFLDSDGDGLLDSVELANSLDPFSRDSDADGLSDFDEFSDIYTSSSLQLLSIAEPQASVASVVANSPDTDGDGLSNFMESYGFHIIDNTPSLVPRRISVSDWNALKSDATSYQGVQVFDVALSRLELDSRAVSDPNNDQFLLLSLDGAKNAIIDAYINAGISSTNIAIEGLTNVNGSAADIVDKLLSNELAQSVDDDGNPLAVYFTHPRKISTDHDPYTDLQEVLGIFPAGQPVAPADHPLVAAAPALRATLESFDVILVEQNRNTLGEREGQITGTTTSERRSQSHGFSVAIKREKEYGASPKVKASIELKQSNSWSFGSSSSVSERNSFSTYTANSNTTQSDCFARLDLSLAVENTGYANASNISLAFNVYVGNSNEPWQTFSLGASDFGNLFLAPGQKHAIAALREGEGACLTIDETNYLAQGGVISIETIVADATVDFFDAGSNLVQQGGSWQVYKALIEQDLAMINIDVNATNGEQINHSFYYAAAQDDYPNLRLSIGDVLAIAFEQNDCEPGVDPDFRCYLTPENQEIILGDNTFFDTVFYNAFGQSLSLLAMEDKFRALEPLDNSDIFAKQLPERSAVTVINNDFEAPQFTHIEVINRVRGEQGSAPDVEIRATVNDFFGIDLVEFCFDQDNCLPMNNVIDGNDIVSRSGLFSITLPNYNFTGNEFLKALNAVGNESQNQNPRAFFLILHENLENQVEEYSEHLREIQAHIDALSRLQSDDPLRYNNLVNAGFVERVGTAQSQLDALIETEEFVQSSCAISLTSGEEQTNSDFAARFSQCQSEVLNFAQSIQNSEIKAFNVAKLPRAHLREGLVGRTKAGEDRSEVGEGELHSVCFLDENQYAVGLGMHKANDRHTPVDMTINYVEYNPLTQTLTGPHNKICGSTAIERSNTLAVNLDAHRAELILDVGIDMRDSITRRVGGKPRGSARYVDKLCVSYRTFDFSSGEWIGDRKFKCNNGNTNGFSSQINLETGMAALDNQTFALKGLSLYHVESRYTSDERDLFGSHVRLGELTTNSVPFHTLNEFTEYALVNEASGDLLTVTSTSAGSAALGMESVLLDDTQTWNIERINDRSMRLIPKAFAEGVLVRNVGFEPSVAKLDDSDLLTANELQHFAIRKISTSGQDAYVIASVIDDRVLARENGELVWQKLKPTSSFPVAQRWFFMPIKNEPAIAENPVQTKVFTNSTQSGLGNACSMFDLGDNYHVKSIRVKGQQNIYNKSLRAVRLNPSDEYLFFAFPGGGTFNVGRRFNVMSNATSQIEVCNHFFSGNSFDPQAFTTGNTVDSIEVEVVPVDAARFQ